MSSSQSPPQSRSSSCHSVILIKLLLLLAWVTASLFECLSCLQTPLSHYHLWQQESLWWCSSATSTRETLGEPNCSSVDTWRRSILHHHLLWRRNNCSVLKKSSTSSCQSTLVGLQLEPFSNLPASHWSTNRNINDDSTSVFWLCCCRCYDWKTPLWNRPTQLAEIFSSIASSVSSPRWKWLQKRHRIWIYFTQSWSH